MTSHKGKEPAFIARNEFEAHRTKMDGSPCECSYGLTKREWFAGMAIPNLAYLNPAMTVDELMSHSKIIASYCVSVADALLEELEKTEAKEKLGEGK